MTQKIVFIHTLSSLIQVFNALGKKYLPEVQFIHILDEPILEHIHQNSGALDHKDAERVFSHVESARLIGASGILVTCSVLSVSIDDVRTKVDIPIIKIDEALVELAVRTGEHIGMLATNPDTMEPSAKMLHDQAIRVGKTVTVTPVLVEHAFAAIRNGDGDTHDKLVKQALLDLSSKVDVIVLAQASMARVLDVLSDEERKVPILSSPHLAIEKAKLAIDHKLA